MDFDNMSKEELIYILRGHYAKLKKSFGRDDAFTVGHYYWFQQTDNDNVEVYANGVMNFTLAEMNEYFETT